MIYPVELPQTVVKHTVCAHQTAGIVYEYRSRSTPSQAGLPHAGACRRTALPSRPTWPTGGTMWQGCTMTTVWQRRPGSSSGPLYRSSWQGSSWRWPLLRLS